MSPLAFLSLSVLRFLFHLDYRARLAHGTRKAEKRRARRAGLLLPLRGRRVWLRASLARPGLVTKRRPLLATGALLAAQLSATSQQPPAIAHWPCRYISTHMTKRQTRTNKMPVLVGEWFARLSRWLDSSTCGSLVADGAKIALFILPRAHIPLTWQ